MAIKTPRSSSTLVDDVMWVYGTLDNPNVRLSDAPTVGAWNMRAWARESRNRFYASLLPRAIAAQAAESAAFYERLGPEGVERLRREFDLVDDLNRMEEASPEMIAAVQELVAQWSETTATEFPIEAAESLACRLAGVVQELEELAAQPQ